MNEVIRSGAQTQVVKSDQELSIIDVKNFLTIELRGVEGSTAVSEEPPLGAGVANAMFEKSVCETQNVARSLDAHVERVYSTASDLGSAIFIWTVEIARHVVTTSRSGVSDERTACARRKQKGCRKALVPLHELVMFVPMEKR